MYSTNAANYRITFSGGTSRMTKIALAVLVGSTMPIASHAAHSLEEQSRAVSDQGYQFSDFYQHLAKKNLPYHQDGVQTSRKAFQARQALVTQKQINKRKQKRDK